MPRRAAPSHVIRERMAGPLDIPWDLIAADPSTAEEKRRRYMTEHGIPDGCVPSVMAHTKLHVYRYEWRWTELEPVPAPEEADRVHD